MRRNYRVWKKEQNDEKNPKKANDQNTTAAVFGEDEELVVLSFNKNESQVIDPYVEWVIDSAASYHATSKKDVLTTY